MFLFYAFTIEINGFSPTYLVLYNTIDSDVGLAYLTTAMVTITVGDMILSLVTRVY